MSYVPGLPLFSTQTVIAATPAKVGETGARRLMKVVVYAATDTLKVEFKNGATDTGTVLLTLQGQDDGPSISYDFTSVGGIMFTTAMFCKPVGTGGIVYVWYD